MLATIWVNKVQIWPQCQKIFFKLCFSFTLSLGLTEFPKWNLSILRPHSIGKHVIFRIFWEIFDTLMENCSSFDIFWASAKSTEIIRKLLPEMFSFNHFQHYLPTIAQRYKTDNITKLEFRWFYSLVPFQILRIQPGWAQSWSTHQRHFWDPEKQIMIFVLLNNFEVPTQSLRNIDGIFFEDDYNLPAALLQNTPGTWRSYGKRL